MSDYVTKTVCFVNSNNRVTGTTSDCYCNLYPFVRTPNEYNHCSLLTASIPKSYYLFDQYNDNFQLNEGGTLVTINIPDGNYNINQLLAALNLAMQPPNTQWTYNVTVNSLVNKLIFTVTGNSSQPSIIFENTSAYLQLGCNDGTTSFVTNTLNAPNCYNLQNCSTINLYSDMSSNESLLASIVPNVPQSSLITFAAPSPGHASVTIGTKNSPVFRFYLINGDTGNPLNLNGVPFNFTICLYKFDEWHSILINDRRMQKMTRQLVEEYKKSINTDI